MADLPYPATTRPIPVTPENLAQHLADTKTWVYEVLRYLYEEKLGGIEASDEFSTTGDELSLNLDADGGLQFTSGELGIKLNGTNLELSTSGLKLSDTISLTNVTLSGTLGPIHGYTQATPYAQVITVAKSGGDYTSIQDAIDYAVTQTPSTTNRFLVKVQSGVYSEAITCANYVDVIGAGRTNTILSATSGTALTFPSTKCTVSEIGINVNYGALGATSTAITSAGADSVLKDCDITVTKSSGDYIMTGMEISAGSFRMSDCYFTYTDTSGATGTQLVQSAIKQTGTLTNVILNNNEITITTTDTNDDLVGVETTATVTGTCILANNIIDVDAGAAGSSATGIWAYGTCSGATFSQNRITVNCNASSYGLWIDSTAGGGGNRYKAQ